MHVLDKMVATLRDEGAQGSKLFVILAVRSCEGIVDETMRGWVQDVGFATHMEVGPLSLEAARQLAVVSTPGGPSHGCQTLALSVQRVRSAFVTPCSLS